MNCKHPVTVFNPLTGKSQRVPCGQCSACTSNKMLIYRNMLDIEQSNCIETYFITLTYDELSVPSYKLNYNTNTGSYTLTNVCPRDISSEDFIILPQYENETVEKVIKRRGTDFVAYPYYRDVQLYLKRLRFYYEKNYSSKFRFYCVSEYGPKHLRPHFHLLLFFDRRVPDEMFVQFTKGWPFGFVDAQLAKHASQYLSQYLSGKGYLPSFYRDIAELQVRCTHSSFLGAEKCDKTCRTLFASDPRTVAVDLYGTVEEEYSHSCISRWQNIRKLLPRCPQHDYKNDKHVSDVAFLLPFAVGYMREKKLLDGIDINSRVSLTDISKYLTDNIIYDYCYITHSYRLEKKTGIDLIDCLIDIIRTNNCKVLDSENNIDAKQLIFVHGLFYRYILYSCHIQKLVKSYIENIPISEVVLTYKDLITYAPTKYKITHDILDRIYLISQYFDLFHLNKYYKSIQDICDKYTALNFDVTEYIQSYYYDYINDIPTFDTKYIDTPLHQYFAERSRWYKQHCVKHKRMNDELTDLFNPANIIRNNSPF